MSARPGLCVSEGLHFCISCHISCLSPALLSRLPAPVSLMGLGRRVEGRGWGLEGLVGWVWGWGEGGQISGRCLARAGDVGWRGHMLGPRIKRSDSWHAMLCTDARGRIGAKVLPECVRVCVT